MNQTKMYMLTETSKFMMAYVIVTQENNVVVIDGGREEDVPLLREYVGGRKIKAWFLTHPHMDHINAFNHVVRTNDPAFDIEAVYCNFPPVEFIREYEIAEAYTSDEFNELRPVLGDRLHLIERGDTVQVDEISFECIYSWKPEYNFNRNAVNDSSIVLRMTTPNTSVMFLGDLGPEGGDKLLELSRDKLPAEYCQMAHHGHMSVSMDVYFEISPAVCLWNAPDWLYEEEDKFLKYRMYGVKTTRRWMERIGAKKHIVTKDGTAEILL